MLTEQERQYQRTYYHSHYSVTARGLQKRAPWTKEKSHQRDRFARYRAIEYLGGVCKDCGYATNLSALEFDHVPGRGEKSRSVKTNWPWKRLQEELDKCDLVCANCHNIRTALRRDS